MLTAEQGLCRLSNQTIAISILSLIEACKKKIAYWINDSYAPTWMKNMLHARYLVRIKRLQNLFSGKNIQSLLRWKMNSCNHQLSWHLAA